MGAVDDVRSISRSNIVCLEGNGVRPSHRGDGYKKTGIMYTLNSTEVHGVAYEVCDFGTSSERLKTEDCS